MRFIEIRFFGRDRREITNPIATIILIPFIAAPQILGIFFWDNMAATVWSTLGVGLLFVTTYFVGMKIAKPLGCRMDQIVLAEKFIYAVMLSVEQNRRKF